jgi:hypothetical protein
MADGMEQAQGALKQSREAMEKQLAALDKKLEGDSLSDEERTQTEEAQTHLRTAIEAMEKGEANPGLGNLTAEGRKVAAANVVLLKTYDKQVQAMASSAFDSFLLGGSGTDAPEGASAQEDD